MSIGEKIAYYRKKAEMSQEELGNQLGNAGFVFDQ